MLKKVRVQDAVGMVVGHDMTRVMPGESSGPGFRRGDVIKEEDIPLLLSMGKEHIYVVELEEDEVHEEEAAKTIAKAVAGEGLEFGRPREGRVNILSTRFGLLKVNVPLLQEINSIPDIVLATRHNNTVCNPGEIVAGTKIIPLYTARERLQTLQRLCQDRGPVLTVKPFLQLEMGVVVTGSEVYQGLITDRFTELVRHKVEAFGSRIKEGVIVPDNEELIADAITGMHSKGCKVIFVCGGLSVDPDDMSVEGIVRAGATVISRGAPVMPSAMFLLATLEEATIIGIPASALVHQTTAVDVVLPRLLAGEEVSSEDIVALGHGGLCLDCDFCTYPICPFCK